MLGDDDTDTATSDSRSFMTNKHHLHQHLQHQQMPATTTRGIIRFRPIQPHDRNAIQKLHELWFPVDYTPDFFDMLCCTTITTATENTTSNDDDDDDDDDNYSCDRHDVDGDGEQQQRRQMHHEQKKRQPPPPLPTMNSFYTCVAYYEELDDDEFEKYQSLLRRRRKWGKIDSGDRTTHYFGGSSSEDVEVDVDTEHYLHHGIAHEDEHDYHRDFLLWNSEENSTPPKVNTIHDNYADDDDDEDDDDECSRKRIGCINQWRMMGGGNSYRREAEPTTATNDRNNYISDDDDENCIKSAESNKYSVHLRTERERMKRFYSNVCVDHRDRDDYGILHSADYEISKTALQQPCYNEKGERIIGCVIGSFMPSLSVSTTRKPPQQRQRQSSSASSFKGKKLSVHNQRHQKQQPAPPPQSRDETAALLIPNPSVHRTMFYIMTLGTCQEFRRCGLGSILVNRIVDMIQSQGGELRRQQHHNSRWQHLQKSIASMTIKDETAVNEDGGGGGDGGSGERNDDDEKKVGEGVGRCGALYLHVITYNKGAIRMYERLGFMRVKKIEGTKI